MTFTSGSGIDPASLLASNPDYVANDVNELAEIIHSALAAGR